MNFFVLIGVLFLGRSVFAIFTGEIGRKSQRVKRSQSPIAYWFVTVLMFAAGLFMVIPGSIKWLQFGIEDTSADTQRKVEEFKQSHTENTLEEELKEIREEQAKHRDQQAVQNPGSPTAP